MNDTKLARSPALRLALLAALAAVVPACGDVAGGGVPITTKAEPLAGPDYGGAITGDAPGTATMLARGGRGTIGSGGNGGIVRVNAITASETKIRSTGSVVTTFVMPTANPPLGPNPLTVDADLTLEVGDELTPGVTTILGDNGVDVATGLRVLQGVTLTLGPNWDADNADADGLPETGTLEQCRLAFVHGVVIEGNLRTLLRDASPHRGHFFIHGGDVVVRSTATVDTSGDDVAAGSGDGAAAGNIHFEAWGTLINEAPLTAVGGDGDNGGPGGVCWLLSDHYSAFNSGNVDFRGGEGLTGVGGNGGGFRFEAAALQSAMFGDLAGGGGYNTGNALAKGGDGVRGGGPGGIIDFYSVAGDGPFVNDGAELDASGGNATVDGNGGNGGSVALTSMGGIARITGTLRVKGGNGAGPGNGGNGGYIEASANIQILQVFNGGCFVGASLDSSGGDGAQGGNGGSSNIWNNSNFGAGQNFARPGFDPTVVVGYSGFDAGGGDGVTQGGNGGTITLANRVAFDPGGVPRTDSLTNEVPGLNRGGAASAGNGGWGGYTEITSWATNAVDGGAGNYDRVIENLGDFDATGGAGGLYGGGGGFIVIEDDYHVVNRGDLTTTGGRGGANAAGGGGGIQIVGNGIAYNEGNLTADGGAGFGDAGGGGSQIFVQAAHATSIGTLRARGGQGAPGAGGSGGAVEIGSWNGTNSVVEGSLEVPRGGGTPPGGHGIVTIDGLRMPLVDGVITF
jgi:hypothetical protein